MSPNGTKLLKLNSKTFGIVSITVSTILRRKPISHKLTIDSDIFLLRSQFDILFACVLKPFPLDPKTKIKEECSD